VLDGLPAHKKAVVKDYVASTQGKLTLHYLPGYAPDLNPDELVWSHAKRTGHARRPLQAGEKLEERVSAQLADIGKNPALVLPSSDIQVSPIFLTSGFGVLARNICKRHGGTSFHAMKSTPSTYPQIHRM
jgi:hypothetical protein